MYSIFTDCSHEEEETAVQHNSKSSSVADKFGQANHSNVNAFKERVVAAVPKEIPNPKSNVSRFPTVYSISTDRSHEEEETTVQHNSKSSSVADKFGQANHSNVNAFNKRVVTSVPREIPNSISNVSWFPTTYSISTDRSHEEEETTVQHNSKSSSVADKFGQANHSNVNAFNLGKFQTSCYICSTKKKKFQIEFCC